MSETTQLREAIQGAIADNPVILFMKGTPEAPACGFSARTVAALQSLDAPFAAVNVLPDPRIRQELSGLPSCSSTASWSVAATSSWRCMRPASYKRRSGSKHRRQRKANWVSQRPTTRR